MTQTLSNSEQIERVRQAVIKSKGDVTIGDIMSATGLGNFEAKQALDHLIATHEGVMRVSSQGELIYGFAPGCVLRDQRSWWERNKQTILKGVKLLFKIIIMLVIVIYFIIYLIILLALLSRRDNDNDGGLNLNGAIWIFWGYGDRGYNEHSPKKEPLYTRIFNFVFGPEEETIDPFEARTKCAQLIRAKKGVIAVEDWMMVSGQSKAKCESDLARYTAEFEGNVEISNMGTLIYTFESMMKSTDRRTVNSLPVMAWNNLEEPRPLTGNKNGGNGLVIGLNVFNLIMSFFFTHALSNEFTIQGDNGQQITVPLSESAESVFFWLGLFPLIFSCLIFSGPLVRLPGHIKENKYRRERSVRKAVIYSVFQKTNGSETRFSLDDLVLTTNSILNRQYLDSADEAEIRSAMYKLCNELDGEIEDSISQKQTWYKFKSLDERRDETAKEREKLALDKQEMGEVVFSTDNREQEAIEDAEEKARLNAFDQYLKDSYQKDKPDYDNYGDQNSSRPNHQSKYL